MLSQLPPKNILFIMFDQLRFDYLSCTGHPHLHTPHIDRLAQQSVRFSQCYVQSPEDLTNVLSKSKEMTELSPTIWLSVIFSCSVIKFSLSIRTLIIFFVSRLSFFLRCLFSLFSILKCFFKTCFSFWIFSIFVSSTCSLMNKVNYL